MLIPKMIRPPESGVAWRFPSQSIMRFDLLPCRAHVCGYRFIRTLWQKNSKLCRQNAGGTAKLRKRLF
jgi:hypothetical protein